MPGAIANPLRLSLDGLDDPGSISAAAPGRPEPPRFVAVEEPPEAAGSAAAVMPGSAARRVDEDDRFELVPTQELPRPVGVVDPGLPDPHEASGQTRLLEGAGATVVPPLMPEHALGGFGAASAPSGEGRDGDAVEIAVLELGAAPVEADSDPESPVAGAAPQEPLDMRRMVTVFVVVPLVLAATILLWRLDRGGRRGRRQATHRSARSRRS